MQTETCPSTSTNVGSRGKTQGAREKGNAGVQGGTTINHDFTKNTLNNKKVSLIIGFIS